MTCVNFGGTSILKLFIFKRNTKPTIDYTSRCEAIAIMIWQDLENGYMTSEIFL